MHKSVVIPIEEFEEVERKAEELGCAMGNLPNTYLGLPLGAKYKFVRLWDIVVERFEKRLAGWKTIYLSQGGRLTLIKSTLSNLPIDFMSLLVMPTSVKNRLEGIMRTFLWSGSGEDHKLASVKWSIVIHPRERGGLGIKSFGTMNKALLGKWIWRYGKGEGSLWKDLLRWKYGEGRGRWSVHSRGEGAVWYGNVERNS